MVYYTRKNKLNKRKNRVTRGGAARAKPNVEELINEFISRYNSLTKEQKKQYCDTNFAKHKNSVFYIIKNVRKTQITKDNGDAYLYILNFINNNNANPVLKQQVTNFINTLNKSPEERDDEETPPDDTPRSIASDVAGELPPPDTGVNGIVSSIGTGAANMLSGLLGTTSSTGTTGSEDIIPKDDVKIPQTTQPTSSPNIATTVKSTLTQLSEPNTMEQLRTLIANLKSSA